MASLSTGGAGAATVAKALGGHKIGLLDAPVELKQAGITQRDALLQICDEARVWRSLEGEAFASVPVRGHIEHHPLASRSFRNWMLHRLACRIAQNGRPASANENAVRDSRAAIEARALVDGIAHPVALRLVEQDSAINLDLGTPDWSVVKITADGWSVAPLPILRGKRAAPFVAPTTSGDFGPLRRLLAHLDEDSFILLVAWCLGALMPSGPYPILVLGGEQGAGKSTLARLVQRIVDPVHGDLLQPPGDDRDLIAAAKANRVLAFDNLSGIRADLADSLCRLSTGNEIGGRDCTPITMWHPLPHADLWSSMEFPTWRRAGIWPTARLFFASAP